MCLVGELLRASVVEAGDRDRDLGGKAIPTIGSGSLRHLDLHRGVRDILAGIAGHRHQGALDAAAPGGGEELLRIGSRVGAVELRAAKLDVQDAIVADGVAKGEFKVTQAEVAAVVIFDATLRFHHPAFVADNLGSEADRQLSLVLDLMIAGLKAGVV